MTDMTFTLLFEANAAKAMEVMRQMQAAQKGMDQGKVAADVAKAEKSMQNTAAASERNTKAATAHTKELEKAARAQAEQTRAAEATKAATDQTAANVARSEASMQQQARAESERAARSEAERRQALEAEIARRRVAYREFERADQARKAAAREPYMDAYRQHQREAEAIARAARQTEAATKAAAQAQREAAQATARTGEVVAQTESRWRRVGQALSGINWRAIASAAAVAFGTAIADSVKTHVINALVSVAGRIKGIIGQAATGFTDTIYGAWGQQEQRHQAVLSTTNALGAEKARASVAAAEQASISAGNVFSSSDLISAQGELSKAGIAGDGALYRRLGDTAIGASTPQYQVQLAEVAQAYAATVRDNDIGQLARILGAKVNDNSLSFMRGGQQVSLPIGDQAATTAAANELLNVHAGRQQEKAATVSGVTASAINTGQYLVGQALDVVANDYIRPRLEALQRQMAGAGLEGAQAMARAIGEDIVRRLGEAEQHLKGIFETLKSIAGPANTVAQALGGWHVVIAGLVGLNVIGWMAGVASGLAAISAASLPVTLTVLAVAAAIAAVAAGAYYIYQNWGSIGPWLSNLWTSIADTARSAWNGLIDWFAGLGGRIGSALVSGWSGTLSFFADMGSRIGGALSSISQTVVSWASSIGAAITQVGETIRGVFVSVFDSIGGFVTNRINDIVNGVGRVRSAIVEAWQFVTGDASTRQNIATQNQQASVIAAGEQARAAQAAIDALGPAAQAAVAQVSAILTAANFHAQGVAMMTTLAGGIRAGAGAAVAAVAAVTQQIRDHLPHSPAKVGALSDLDRVRFSETLASAIRPEPAVAAVRAVAVGMRAAIPAAGMAMGIGAAAAAPAIGDSAAPLSRPGSGSVSVVYSPTVTLPPGASREDFASLLEQHKNEISRLVQEVADRRSELRFD
ncbi:hypothetical protein [Camelimonas lactis]|uniref:Tail length tape measure protein n=1 Tax=Camelimonas lactis TaxID=659006 RepID=A0A4R2GW39_9HYPH|nr:hypothetical protein [Camelimonas lactis]TCO15230.1 hypothetical protein EV666_102208 [Camelimonas lactis]